MKRILAFGLIVLSAAGVSLSAKGMTTRITIGSADLAAPVEITDVTITQRFQVWSGPGVSSARGGIVTEETEGFIIDWRSGVVAERPRGLRRYEISFYTGDDRIATAQPGTLAYVVLYDYDPASEHDHVYLPGKSDQWYGMNVGNIYHGLEGHWFRASAAWQSVARPLIARGGIRQGIFG